MYCRRVVNSISAYVDGELTGAEMLDIRRHLEDCPECMEEYESLRETKLMVARLANVTPRADFAASIIHKLNQTTMSPHQKLLTRMTGYLGRKLSPAVAALAVSGIAFAILAAGGQNNLEPGSEVVANAPVSVYKQNISFTPEIPENPILYSNSGPVVIANEADHGSLQFVDFATR